MTTRPSDMPPEIGPHEGRELEMMLAGEKPLAMFSDVVPPSFDWDEDQFQLYVDQGRLLKHEQTLQYSTPSKHQQRFVYFALPNERWRIDRMSEINQHLSDVAHATNQQIEAEIGQLLGYSEREIDVYITRFFSKQWRRKFTGKSPLL